MSADEGESKKEEAPGEILRYAGAERVTHWTVAILFVLLAASGLALFHPAFWFLSSLLGGGTWSRILHPFLGVLMFLLFAVMAVRYWPDNRIAPHDREWRKRLVDVINNKDENLPPIDKYNVGQKLLFQVMIVTMTLLLLSGLALWANESLHVVLVRIGALIHALAAFVLILGVIVHVYAGVFWVKGSLRAMTRGSVSAAWAKQHHPLWHERMTGSGNK